MRLQSRQDIFFTDGLILLQKIDLMCSGNTFKSLIAKRDNCLSKIIRYAVPVIKHTVASTYRSTRSRDIFRDAVDNATLRGIYSSLLQFNLKRV